VPYAAPELFMSRQFDERVDIFSFGLVMWEVFAGVCVCVCAQPNVACRVVFGMLGCSPQL
jgi:serine/threonine protein kinase